MMNSKVLMEWCIYPKSWNPAYRQRKNCGSNAGMDQDMSFGLAQKPEGIREQETKIVKHELNMIYCTKNRTARPETSTLILTVDGRMISFSYEF